MSDNYKNAELKVSIIYIKWIICNVFFYMKIIYKVLYIQC